MQRPKHMRAQVGSLLKTCAEAAGRVGIGAAREVVTRLDRASENGPGTKVVEAISKSTEQLIAKSPVPIPGPVREALGRMREALDQLSSSIETVNAGASSLTRDTEKQDPSRRRAMDDARAAFVGLEADDAEGQGAAGKNSRRQRPRRGQRDIQNEPTFKKDRASQTPSNS